MNNISVFRKVVSNNIPMFDDDETGNPQDKWVKLYDFNCVDVAMNWDRNGSLEHDPKYSNQQTTRFVDYYFSNAGQAIEPPYDVHEGDYVVYKQNGAIYTQRIVSTSSNQILPQCMSYQLTCDTTSPREAERVLGLGFLMTVEESEL